MKESIKKYWIYYIIGIALIAFIVRTVYFTNEYRQLAKNGKTIFGIVIDRVKESSSYRNNDGYYYQFRVNGIKFEGYTFDEKFKPKDSILIIYLPDNPNINKDFAFIKDNY